MDQLTPNPKLYNVPFATDSFNGMPYRCLGRSGLRVSAVGLGTWKIGFPETGDGSRTNEKTAFAIFDRCIELGVTFWDTANRYNFGSGNSERVIGRWLRANPDQRRNVVIATKCYGGMDGVTPNHSRLGRSNVIESVKACMARLQVDYIDVLYFHCYDDTTPVEESLGTVEDVVSRDMVRYFAVSNFTVDQIKLYQAAERDASVRCRALAVQNQFDILSGESSGMPGALDYAAYSGVSFVAWSPLARGLLTEKYLDPTKAGRGDRLYDEGDLKQKATPETMEKVGKLAAVAHEKGLQLNQLALAYMLTLPGMGPVIPSASSPQQVESNAQAGKVTLDDETRMRVKEILQGSKT